MDYWDTAALLKLYVPEHDSAYFLELIAHAKQAITSSAVAMMEVLCALEAKERGRGLRSGGAKALYRRFRADCDSGRIVLLPYGADVISEGERLVKLAFEQSRPVMIRSLDLIYLASASVSKAKALVTTDQRLREFASLLRFELLP